MAKIQGPAFSLAASGTLAKTIAFQQRAGKSFAQRVPFWLNPATARQALRRAKFAEALVAYATLPSSRRDEWVEAAAIRDRQAQKLFVSEYLIQRATPENLPLIPAVNY